MTPAELDALERRYIPVVVPPCSVCGAVLHVAQETREVRVWTCVGTDHYLESMYSEPLHTDPAVVALVAHARRLEAELDAAHILSEERRALAERLMEERDELHVRLDIQDAETHDRMRDLLAAELGFDSEPDDGGGWRCPPSSWEECIGEVERLVEMDEKCVELEAEVAELRDARWRTDAERETALLRLASHFGGNPMDGDLVAAVTRATEALGAERRHSDRARESLRVADDAARALRTEVASAVALVRGLERSGDHNGWQCCPECGGNAEGAVVDHKAGCALRAFIAANGG